MREQILIYYPLMSFEEIDWQIKQVGKVWNKIKNIEITYQGGAYQVSMLAIGIKNIN